MLFGANVSKEYDIAMVIFLVIKGMNAFKRKKEEAVEEVKPAEPSEEVLLLREIRDSLKNNKE